MSCLSDSELWICGFHDKIVTLNLLGELLRSVQTKSGNWSVDITMTKSEDLLYTDPGDSSINLVGGTKVRRLIRLRRLVSSHLCSKSSGDLLITMDSDEKSCITKAPKRNKVFSLMTKVDRSMHLIDYSTLDTSARTRIWISVLLAITPVQ